MIIHWIQKYCLQVISLAFYVRIAGKIRTICLLIINYFLLVEIECCSELLRIETCKIFLHLTHFAFVEAEYYFGSRVVPVIVVVDFATFIDVSNCDVRIRHCVETVV